MAKYELPIYGENDELIKTYETNHVKWAVYVQAADIQDSIKPGTAAMEYINKMGEVLKQAFTGLTDEELMCADGMDVINTFTQIVNGGQHIKGASKNA